MAVRQVRSGKGFEQNVNRVGRIKIDLVAGPYHAFSGQLDRFVFQRGSLPTHQEKIGPVGTLVGEIIFTVFQFDKCVNSGYPVFDHLDVIAFLAANLHPGAGFVDQDDHIAIFEDQCRRPRLGFLFLGGWPGLFHYGFQGLGLKPIKAQQVTALFTGDLGVFPMNAFFIHNVFKTALLAIYDHRHQSVVAFKDPSRVSRWFHGPCWCRSCDEHRRPISA
ncbi:hypothetical protein DESC_740112 [Desulfosarcina cetonica]|nr:hypothetical protein DESC_740112 [Desulfosarcina cetonica]